MNQMLESRLDFFKDQANKDIPLHSNHVCELIQEIEYLTKEVERLKLLKGPLTNLFEHIVEKSVEVALERPEFPKPENEWVFDKEKTLENIRRTQELYERRKVEYLAAKVKRLRELGGPFLEIFEKDLQEAKDLPDVPPDVGYQMSKEEEDKIIKNLKAAEERMQRRNEK